MSLLPEALNKVIEEFENLPGIGPRSAARLAYYLLRAPESTSNNLAKSIENLKKSIKLCQNCFNYADEELCNICSNPARFNDIVLVVEEPLDVVAFERIGSYKGIYHVLGGVISPVNGIGPDEIRINELMKRIKDNEFKEVIIATNPNLEGESTAIYIKKSIQKISPDIKISRLARGLPTGADLEYADESTLERALEGRSEF